VWLFLVVWCRVYSRSEVTGLRGRASPTTTQLVVKEGMVGGIGDHAVATSRPEITKRMYSTKIEMITGIGLVRNKQITGNRL
jgi:hypothetical protein